MLKGTALAILLLFASASAWLARPASAEMIEILAADARGGVEASIGQCPCIRMSIQVKALGGQWETRDFLISSDSLLSWKGRNELTDDHRVSRLFRLGAMDALLKSGHVGLRFDGISLGRDEDRGYSDVLRTGVHALVSALRQDAWRMDLASGYELEKLRVNLGPRVERHQLVQQASLKWETGRWSGNVRARVGLDATAPSELGRAKLAAGSGVGLRVFNLSDLAVGLGLDVGVERDPFRKLFGLAEDNLVASLMVTASWANEPRQDPAEDPLFDRL